MGDVELECVPVSMEVQGVKKTVAVSDPGQIIVSQDKVDEHDDNMGVGKECQFDDYFRCFSRLSKSCWL